MIIKRINKCRFCKSKKLEKIINLGPQYLQGYFESKSSIKKNLDYKKKYLTEIVRCNPQKDKKACGLVQLSISVPSNILYKKYFYRSGINYTMKTHLKKIAIQINSYLKSKKKINILDIGCNDGTMLKFFSKKFNKYGIDPSNSFPKSGIKNVKFINDFFPSTKLKSIYKFKKFDVITSIAMFYDLEDPSYFVKNINNLLSENGFWVFEVSYMPEMLKLNSFDTICHEHLEYYSLSVINKILQNNNLKIAKVEFNKSNGGSIRCFVVKSDNKLFSTKKDIKFVKKILYNEKKLKLHTNIPYKKFVRRILNLKKRLKNLIVKLNSEGKTIHAYGASTKGNTILQFCEINNKLIEFAADRNPDKVGLRTLGSNIKIISESESKRLNPDYYLVLPWHFEEEFIKREKLFLKKGGKLIFPLPNIKVI